MSTWWWIVVCWLACSVSFALGYVVRAQFELYHRQVYDVDFTRTRLGEKS